MPGLLAYVPTAQLAQSYWEGDPVASRNVPAPQLTQEVCPLFSLYFPRSQEVQEDCPSALLALPRAQATHVEAELAPTADDDVPAAQGVHEAESVRVE